MNEIISVISLIIELIVYGLFADYVLETEIYGEKFTMKKNK